jgi:hypothetical protein
MIARGKRPSGATSPLELSVKISELEGAKFPLSDFPEWQNHSCFATGLHNRYGFIDSNGMDQSAIGAKLTGNET